MAPSVRRLVMVMLLMLTPGVVGAADRVFRSDRDGIEFRYPDRFVPGRYKRQPLDPETLKQLQESGVGEPYANAIALIESARVRGFAATDIPIGQVPTITVNPHTGGFASFLNGQFGKKEFETAIGGRRVFRLPGFPGPYGDTAFYYLVPIADDRMVELFAHRAYLDQAKTPMHYDQVIEHIISTLAVFAPSRQ